MGRFVCFSGVQITGIGPHFGSKRRVFDDIVDTMKTSPTFYLFIYFGLSLFVEQGQDFQIK